MNMKTLLALSIAAATACANAAALSILDKNEVASQTAVASQTVAPEPVASQPVASEPVATSEPVNVQ